MKKQNVILLAFITAIMHTSCEKEVIKEKGFESNDVTVVSSPVQGALIADDFIQELLTSGYLEQALPLDFELSSNALLVRRFVRNSINEEGFESPQKAKDIYVFIYKNVEDLEMDIMAAEACYYTAYYKEEKSDMADIKPVPVSCKEPQSNQCRKGFDTRNGNKPYIIVCGIMRN